MRRRCAGVSRAAARADIARTRPRSPSSSRQFPAKPRTWGSDSSTTSRPLPRSEASTWDRRPGSRIIPLPTRAISVPTLISTFV